jgi:hypothetical protein
MAQYTSVLLASAPNPSHSNKPPVLSTKPDRAPSPSQSGKLARRQSLKEQA